MDSRELQALIVERNEAPVLVGTQDAGHDAAELYRFKDGTEVIVTNAGLVTDDADGWADLRAEIVTDDTTLVCGCRVQWDKSGVGHCWVNKDADELPATIREEIEGEIIGGGKEEGQIVGSNGQHYRWS